MCRYKIKKETVNLLADLIPTPTIYKNFNEIEKWPVFLKPDVGQGSQVHILPILLMK